MTTMSVPDATAQLAQLIDRALAGEDVVIARGGQPLIRLVPVTTETKTRRGRGAWRGRVRIADDFDELPVELAAAFDGTQP